MQIDFCQKLGEKSVGKDCLMGTGFHLGYEDVSEFESNGGCITL